jgi:hypothetical protein
MLILAAQAALGFPHQYLGLRYFTLGAAVELRFYLAQQAKVAVMLAVLAALKMTLVMDLMALPIAAVAVAAGLMSLQRRVLAVLEL